MKPSEIASSLQLLAQIHKPAFLWGPPGVGKSQVVAQVATALGIRLIDIRAILLDPVDLRGLPTVEQGRAAWAIPAFLPEDGAGILFLDELNAAPPLVQAACYQLVLDRALGEYRLPDGWTVFAAGNREGDRAVTARMSSALANRFVHLVFETDIDDWSRWAMGAGDLRPEVVAFLRWRPELLHQFEPTEKAFPSPRAWASISHILAAAPPSDVEFALYEGTVGRGRGHRVHRLPAGVPLVALARRHPAQSGHRAHPRGALGALRRRDRSRPPHHRAELCRRQPVRRAAGPGIRHPAGQGSDRPPA